MFNAPRAMHARRTLVAACALLTLLPAGMWTDHASAQTVPPGFERATTPPEAERDSTFYTLNPDGRHGPSFFPRVRHPEVEYEAGATLRFDRYHTVDVMYAWLRRWAERYPNIVELYQVGTSFEGRPIMQVTLTNKSTGPATDKPAAFYEGGRHSGEITSSESVLWLIQHLVENYGSDPEVTALLDRAAVYARPQNNPDGSNMYLHTAQTNRSSVRPIDNDGDGLTDEDPANDLDGDGVVLQMRWRDPEGSFVLDERDPQGRLMRRVEPGEGNWSMGGEGRIDDDGDGRADEDGVGGLDLHRNYVENWRPDRGEDRTGRGWTQGGAGAFPLSEPETRATVLFVLQNPNIAVANSMDTRVPMHLRPPSTSQSEERMYPEDLALYEHFDSVGISITGYPWAGDVYHDYSSRGNPDREGGSPLFGHGPDFGYFYVGAIWYGDELWDGGRVGDVNGDGEEDELDRLIWQDSVANGRAFKPWTAFDHPELGEVEIGGWHPKFFSQNGPPEVLDKWAGNQARFNLYMAQSLPDLRVGEPQVRRVAANADSTTYEIRIAVRNEGRIPTALKQADLVKIVRPDQVELELEGVRTGGQDPEARIVEPGPGGTARLGYIQPGATEEAVFRVVTYGVPGVRGTYVVESTRGGVFRGSFTAGQPAPQR
ncbi:MAG: M14 family metallopeptidase [Gemmatimonadota bacterium]